MGRGGTVGAHWNADYLLKYKSAELNVNIVDKESNILITSTSEYFVCTSEWSFTKYFLIPKNNVFISTFPIFVKETAVYNFFQFGF